MNNIDAKSLTVKMDTAPENSTYKMNPLRNVTIGKKE